MDIPQITNILIASGIDILSDQFTIFRKYPQKINKVEIQPA